MAVVLAALAASVACTSQKQVPGAPYTVGYSTRGLEIDGQPRMLMTGAIHYPRSAPAMWDSLMKKAKKGGLNTIDTYVFWNMHEPVKGHYDFATDRANLPLFLETARRNGLFVMLRIGPYVCAEWNYGGFPQWLRHEPDVVFRTYSYSFMREMKRFIGKVLDVVDPFMPEYGGPIVALQIENEYGNMQSFFGRDGDRYAEWCGRTAQGFNTSVPWVMCAQDRPPASIIPTDNGFYCDQNLAQFRQKYPQFPAMWTELWPAWFQRWGEAAPHRLSEDIAYAVAKWFANGGTYVAYYMYHGGTNFGRTAGPFILTSYDYDGFLDEYGLENWPKYLHLRDLHNVLLDNESFLTLNAVPDAIQLHSNPDATAHVYGAIGEEYLAFLVNSDPKHSVAVKFDGHEFDLPHWSVTIVRRTRGSAPKVLYNTAQMSSLAQAAQNSPAGFAPIDGSVSTETIRWRPLDSASSDTKSVESTRPSEHISVTDDRTDYLWYRTRVKVPAACARDGQGHQLVLHDAGDVAFAYFNGHFAGMRHGREDRLATFTFDVPHAALAQNQSVDITILSQTMGMKHLSPGQETY
ncbi:Beta-galactosidase 8, partial [Coemansia nantahalensis]